MLYLFLSPILNKEIKKLGASFIISYIVKGRSSDKAANEELWLEDFVLV